MLKKLQSTVYASYDDVKLLSCEIQQGNPLPVFQWQVRYHPLKEWAGVSEVLKGKFECNM